MSNYKKLALNTVIMTIGQFSNKLLSFLLVPLYTSLLTTEEYGDVPAMVCMYCAAGIDTGHDYTWSS